MNNDEIVVSKSVVNKVLEVARACVDTERKGWRVRMREFNNAMDDLSFSGNEVGEALANLAAELHLITFLDADGQVKGISVVPQWYQCKSCNLWLDVRDEREHHIDLCLRRQAKMAKNLRLLFGGQWQ